MRTFFAEIIFLLIFKLETNRPQTAFFRETNCPRSVNCGKKKFNILLSAKKPIRYIIQAVEIYFITYYILCNMYLCIPMYVYRLINYVILRHAYKMVR
jgi:hypothetical protein